MSDQNRIERLTALTRRYVWLLAEIHGGNQFSRDRLWHWLTEAETAIAEAGRQAP